MQIGFNLLLWTAHLTAEHYPLFEKLKKTGYDGVELPIFGGDAAHYKEIGKALADNGLRSTAVTVLPDEASSAVSADPKSRAGALDRIKWAVDCLHAAGGETLCGPFHQPLGVFTGEPPTAAEVDGGDEVHTKAADYAAQAGIALSIEPLNRFECYIMNTVAQAASVVKRVDRPNYGLLYDTFHANIEEKDPLGVIKPNLAQINHVHISENDRGTPGKGHIPMVPTFRALKWAGYDGWLVIEAFGRALPDVAAATRVWRDFFPNREEVYEHGYKLIREGWDAA